MFTDKSKNSLPETVVVGDYTVYKLKLKKYPQVISIVQSMKPKIREFIDGKEENEIIYNIPEIILAAYDDVIELIALFTNEEADVIENNVDLPTATTLLKSALQINGFLELYSQATGRSK